MQLALHATAAATAPSRRNHHHHHRCGKNTQITHPNPNRMRKDQLAAGASRGAWLPCSGITRPEEGPHGAHASSSRRRCVAVARRRLGSGAAASGWMDWVVGQSRAVAVGRRWKPFYTISCSVKKYIVMITTAFGKEQSFSYLLFS